MGVYGTWMDGMWALRGYDYGFAYSVAMLIERFTLEITYSILRSWSGVPT